MKAIMKARARAQVERAADFLGALEGPYGWWHFSSEKGGFQRASKSRMEALGRALQTAGSREARYAACETWISKLPYREGSEFPMGQN